MVRGLGDFQRGQIKHRDARINLLFHHLQQALDTLQDILAHPYEPPATSGRPAADLRPAPPAEPAARLPEYATIQQWVAISGMNRTAIYGAMANGNLKAIKIKRRTLIDVHAGLAWMRSQTYTAPGVPLGRR
jgi:hypothetical protein